MTPSTTTAQRAELHKTIWRIANDLRGTVDGWDFKAYVLGFLFYRFISEHLTNYLNEQEHAAGNLDFDYAKLSDEDAEFGRDGFMLSKISTPPYYAAEIEPAAVYTIGGLVCGENMETLDWDGNPIPRLYHAGDVGQPTKFAILTLAGAMATGEIAGTACAQLESH